MTLTTKFKKDLTTLKGAANGDFLLDVKKATKYCRSSVITSCRSTPGICITCDVASPSIGRLAYLRDLVEGEHEEVG